MSELRPVSKTYDPGYPRSLTEREIDDLLRPSLLNRFGKKAMVAAGAVVTGLTLSGAACSLAQPPMGPPLPKAGLSTNKDKAFRDKIYKMSHEVLGDKVGFWDERSSILYKQELANNPPIKYSRIAISFGNSYIGIFDTDKAKEATFKLFEQWGIKLEKDVAIKGEGYEFRADGYNKDLNIGFEIVMPEGFVGLDARKKLPVQPQEHKLDAEELKALDKDIKSGKRRIFVVQGTGYPNMDGDLYTPMQYYLASVIDYLNWVHGDPNMERDNVLGRAKKIYTPVQPKEK